MSILPGVPPLLSVGGFAAQLTAPVALLAADALLVVNSFIGPQWGIFDQDTGAPVIIGDSTVGVEFRKDMTISDFPVEKGAFSSFNKVEHPYILKMMIAKGAVAGFSSVVGGLLSGAAFTSSNITKNDRSSFLNQVDTVLKSTKLYHGVTPEVTYVNANVIHYDYRRYNKEGATMINVNIWLEEVRSTATATFTNTQQPSGSDPVSQGLVQPGKASIAAGTPPT